MKKVRGDSGKKARYEQATEKYKLFQKKKDRINQMDGILTGKQSEVVIPKPGEFFVVSSAPEGDALPSVNRKLIETIVREQHKDSQSPKNQRAFQAMSALSSKNQSMKLPFSMTDRKNKQHMHRQNNLSQGGAPIVPLSTTNKRQTEDKTMSSLQGELNKQMSLPTFAKPNRTGAHRVSHDFPLGINSVKGYGATQHKAHESMQAYGKHGGSSQERPKLNTFTGEHKAEGVHGVSNYDGISNVRFDKESKMSAGVSQYEDELKAAEDAAGVEMTVRRKQSQVLQNASLKTSLTTNIRNIMRNQDKGLLTTSTRLLNAQVKHAELKQKLESQNASLSPSERQPYQSSKGQSTKKAISTVDLLRQQKAIHKKVRQLSLESSEGADDQIGGQYINDQAFRTFDVRQVHTAEEQDPLAASGQADHQLMSNVMSMPVLPSATGLQGTTGFNTTDTSQHQNPVGAAQADVQMFVSHRDPQLHSRQSQPDISTISNRPNTNVLMQIGDKDTKKLIKKKFDIANARNRDPTKTMTHSYKSKLTNPMTTSKKWKDQMAGTTVADSKGGAGQMPRLSSTPMLVQYQNALIREKKNVSPFMVSGPDLDQKHATIEAIKTRKQINDEQKEAESRLHVSQSVKVMQTLNEPLQEHMKYSESMSTLQKLRDVDEDGKNRPSSSVFKKGTSDFLKRKIMSTIGRQAYETGDFKKSLEKRYGTHIQGDSRDRTFLPIEAFDPLLDIEVPQDAIDQFKDPATGETIGLSKWNFPSGEAELRECLVDGYIKNQDVYEIRWCHNREIRKKVSRFNLIFKLEDKEDYERRIFMAHQFRQEAETLMRYHYMIDNYQIPKVRTGGGGKKTAVALPELLDTTKTRISYLISTFKPYRQFVEPRSYKNVQAFFARDFNERYRFIKFFQRWQDFNSQEPEKVVQSIHNDMQNRDFNLALLQRLFEELDEDFLRAHKQIYFDLQLPYDKEKFRLFNHVLPKEKFVPNNEREVDESRPPALKQIPKRESNFERRLDKMSVKLHQGHLNKLKILQMCHRFKQQNLEKRLLQFEFTEPCKLDYLQKEHSLALSKFIKNIEDSRFDCEYDTSAIINEKRADIDQLNAERKNQMTHHQEQYVDIEIPDEFIKSMEQFQRVIQIQFENTMREVFTSSIEQCKEQLRFAMKEIFESTGKPLVDTEANDQINYSLEEDPEKKLNQDDIMYMSRDAVLQTRFRETQCFQFDITLEYDKDRKEIKANPHAEDWINAIPDHFETSLQNLKNVKCFLHERLGRIHQHCGHVVFQTDPECPEEYPEREVLHITFLLQRLFKVLEALLDASNQYSPILKENIKDFAKKQKESELTVDDYQKILKDNKKQMKEIDELFFEDSLQIGPIVARVGDLKKRLKKKLNELNKVLLEEIKKKVEASKQQIGEEVDNILKIICKPKKTYVNIEEVTETKAFLKKLPDKMQEIQWLIRGVNDKVDVLDENNFELSEQEIVQIWESFARPMEVKEVEGDCHETLEELSNDFQVHLREMQSKLNLDIQEIQQDFEVIIEYEALNQHLDASRKTEKLGDRIDETIKIANICNRREKLFGQPETDFSGIKIVQEKFEPFHRLWQLASQYYSNISNWMEGEIFHLDGDALPKTIDEAIQTLKYLKTKHFKDYPYTAQICQELRDLYQAMKPFMPVLSSLKNPDFKIVHYEIIKKDYQIEIDTTLTQSFNQLKEIGVMEIVDEIIEISAIATKERQLESQLNKMNDEWKSVKFDLAEYRDSEVHVLQGVQTIWDLLDEHIQKTMIIASSPYAKFFLSEALYWKSRLVKVQEILEEWSRSQRGWCYLWPIFNSPDIQGQLPEVYLTFTSMDKMWRIIMSQTIANPMVLDACNQHRVFENLQYCNETIENVKKKLNEYLHSKQLLFPRFFFLSNDDLLHILSQTKDPVRVQDHLNKCFEGIQLLHFTDASLIVTSMISAMGEEVAFNATIDPFVIKVHKETIDETYEDGPTGRTRHRSRVVETTVKEVRAIEDWLSDVEFQMRDSLRSNITASTVQYKNVSKADWIFAWPQQIVLAIDQIDWTEKLEKAIQSEAENSLRFAFKAEEEKVADLVDLIRMPNLSKSDQQTLESLIVTDVHSRDTTQELMELNVRDTASFEWISQLRHYTALEESGRDKKKVTRLEIKISMINSTRNYGFEYQGSQTRLVITPLTDRCYRTLMGALQMNLGGAPEGPAGTGKTETTKDLAKALAKQCLVFNCSDQIDVATMGKFFKGLACCGAWACFDEFNRIELEVLSVIAQQILTIQSALMRKKPNAAFMFEEESIVLDAQCAVFITMNPTYAGRSQLPDNLKALFRPVAMMIPNYETIAEIQLYSYGFQNARQLSVKIVQSLKLSSEQLSTQSHYDYGMRAVKSIILASGALRKESPPDQSEDITVLRAISVCNIPKFINEDINQFNGIISDLFPETDNSAQQYEALKHFVEESIHENKLERNNELETKILQLYETVQVRHGLMLVGAPMGGKTTIARTLADALSRIERQKALDEAGNDHSLVTDKSGNMTNSRALKPPKVNIHTINPKSISISKLYGDYEKVGDWMDGILAITVRDSAADKSGDTHWIMLDGPVDTLWIENLNTVLDDNKKLCLISGEIIKLTQQMTMMFEVEDLHEASPATVSRCGMVYVTPEKLGWEPLLYKWVAQLPDGMKEHGSHTIYRDLVMSFVPAIMQFLFGKEQSQEEDQRLEGLKPVLGVSKNWLFRSFLNLFESLLLDDDTLESYNEKQNEANEKREINQKKKQMNHMKSSRTDKTSESDDDRFKSHVMTNQRRSTKQQQKWYDIIEPMAINLLVQKFIMAMIWGFGAHLMTSARPAYNYFMHELIDQVFGVTNCQLEFKKRLDMTLFPKSNCNLFSIFFHTKDVLWHKWDYEIDKYDILGDKEKPVELKIENSQEREEAANESFVGGDGDVSPMGGMQFDEEFQNKVEYQNIMIATEDSIQQQYIMETIVGHQFPMLIVGDTGTGKTRAIKKLISQLMGKITSEGKYGWENGEMVLSATSTPQQIQRYTESKLEKHKKGVYGPKNPNNHLLIFIDDLNMPVKEKFGAQPSIEMMRQIMDSNGFYNEKTLEFSLIVRQLFLCAMGTPGGGRSLPSMRLLRHFNLFNFPNMSKETMTRIFKKILEWGFASYHQSWQKQIITMTEMTIETYQKAVNVLLPLPRKAHYLFNMRQVSEIIQGLFSVPADIIEMQKEKLMSLKRLWMHEVQRVFSDRLISEEDKNLFLQQCLIPEESNFIKATDLESASSIIFCNFVNPDSDQPIYMESKDNQLLRISLAKVVEQYNESKTGGREKMSVLLFDYLLQHMARVSRIIAKPFGNGLLIGLGGNGRKTIAKIATFINECNSFRINLHKNYGQMEWLDDLRNLYKTLGIDNKKIVFSFADKDIKQETFIEDINNILNVGELTSLFNPEDEEEIHYEIEKQLKKAKVKNTSQEATHEFFTKRCKRNLHMLLFMSPAGNLLQSYFRKYPSLVNCTSIDWFLNWPTEALKAVSDHYLLKLQGIIMESTQIISANNSRVEGESVVMDKSTHQRALETIAEGFEEREEGSVAGLGNTERHNRSQRSAAEAGLPSVSMNGENNKQQTTPRQADQEPKSPRLNLTITPPGLMMDELDELDPEAQEIQKLSIRERVSQVFTQIHQSAMELADTYLLETKKQVYITPVMFMSVFQIFENLLTRKNEEIERERSKYEQGVRKLDEAKIMIEEMEEMLTNLQPELVAKTKQVERTVKRLEKESKEVQAIKDVVDAETEEAEAEKRAADEIKTECQQALNLAQPFFDRAIKALRTLSNNDFVLMRSFQNPPMGVRLALEACCIMLGIQPVLKKVDGVKKPDYWDKSKKLLSNYKKMLDQLENYPKENIDPAIIEKIRPYLENPNFQPDVIRGASEAAEGLCKWTIAIIKFDEVYKQITPKRQALEAAEEKVKVTQEKLQEKQAQLNKLQEQIAELQAENQHYQEEKQDLLNKKQDATNKLERANALMSSIGSEKDRWIATKKKLAEDKLSLLGDMIIATSFVNYLGPFEGSYRLKVLTETWQMLNQKYQVKQTFDFNLKEILGDVEQISEWTIRGLPNENMAFENMIIINETVQKKYPVIIDPEGQAFRYMRDNMNVQAETTSYQAQQSRMCLKASNPNAVKQLQIALQQGSIVFCENSGEVTHPALLSIIRKDISTINGDLYISFNDMNIEFDNDFRIYIFSHLSNPHFSPEVQQLSKVLNFSVTREGLEQQLLQIICQNELSREEEDRERYAKQSLQMQKKKREVFDRILNTLRNSGQEILESDGFVKTLNESKETTTEIEKKLKQAKNNEEKIKEMREKFEETAKQGARLYFAVQDLKLLDDMYQFSMNWFRILFKQTFAYDSPDSDEEEKTNQDVSDSNSMMGQPKRRRAAASKPNQDMTKKQKLIEMERRAQVLKNQFREILYRNVCMSLFEHHKLLFAFFISLKVFEKDQSFQEGLDRLKQKHPSPKGGKEFESASKMNQSRMDDSSKVSDQKSSNQQQEQPSHSSVAQSLSRRSHVIKKSVNNQARAGVLSRHDQSDRMTAIDEEREYQQKEEEKKLVVDESLLKYTLTGLMMADSEPYEFLENTRPDLFSEAMWSELHQLTSFQCYEILLEKIIKDMPLWEKFMLCERADHAFDLLPEPFQSSLPHFAWVPLIRCLKPELTTLAIRRYVAKSLGRYFVAPIIFNLREVYESSQVSTPLLLILTPGNDPMDQIISLSKEAQCRMISVSLGKGQGEKAKQTIKECQKGGSWVILQNCHLSKSFLPELEQLVEGLQTSSNQSNTSSSMPGGFDDMTDKKDYTSPGFRIWMTSMSVPYFPQMLLHQSIKVTSEPPKGIKSSMIRSYNSVISSKTELAEYNESKKMDIWQKLYLSLSFFHAIVRERRRFGPLGWTARYDFNDSDFRVSMLQLRNMVDSFEKVPFKALRYLTGLCNYGGRVTDDRDRRTLATILDDFYNENVIGSETYYIVNERFKKYYIFRGETAREYLDYVKHLPDEESPQLMGLHENAIIQQAMNEANTIFQSTLKLTASSASNESGEGGNQLVKKMTMDILEGIREPFKIKDVERKYPFKYEESMNAVLLQELARYNNLIETIRASLDVLKKTLEGKLVSNAETDEILQSIKNNSIPEKWLKRSYPSRKTLLGYVDDLKKRISVYEQWIEHDKPNCFWISGFFFTQSFLTGVKQNYARKHQYPIDKVDFTYKVLKFEDQSMCDRMSPIDGCYLNGFFLEGAAWDDESSVLRDSDPKVIHVPLPVMHFIPKYLLAEPSSKPITPADKSNMSLDKTSPSHDNSSILADQAPKQYVYECPAYKTSERAGQLLTTGHNTNYIQMIDLGSGQEPSIWIRRGVALLCQLDN